MQSHIASTVKAPWHVCRALFERPETESIESFSDLVWEYGQAVLHIPQLLQRLPFRTRTLDVQLQEAMLRGNLRRSFTRFDILMLGVGVIIGSGVWTLTGLAQAQYAGSATLLSYLITGIGVLLAGACYGELCLEYPIAGSGFTYAMVTFGEAPAFLALSGQILAYILGTAFLSRKFSIYLAVLCNQDALFFTFEPNGVVIDVMAGIIILLITAALCVSTRSSIGALNIATLFKMFLVCFIAITGFATANASYFNDNFANIPDKGVEGIAQAIAVVYFAFVGFDAITNAVEETRNPEHIPRGILGSILTATATYMILSASLSLMATPEDLNACTNDRGDTLQPQPENCESPNLRGYQMAFVTAAHNQGLPWMQYILALAALVGILTSAVVSIFSISRTIMVAAREWLVPPGLARISQRTKTPVRALLLLGLVIAILAMFVDSTGSVADLASCGAILSIWIVSNIVLFRRYYPGVKLRFTEFGTVQAEASSFQPESSDKSDTVSWWRRKQTKRLIMWVHLVLINIFALGLVIYYRLSERSSEATEDDHAVRISGRHTNWFSLIFLVGWALSTLSMALFCPLQHVPTTWHIYSWLLPWLPSASLLMACFSLGGFSPKVYITFGVYVIVVLVVYVLFSMPLSYIKHFKLAETDEDQLKVVELVFVNNKWQSAAQIVQSRSAGDISSIARTSAVTNTKSITN